MTEQTRNSNSRALLERLPVTFVVLLGTVVWSHALSALLRAVAHQPFEELAPASAALTLAALFAGSAASLERERRFKAAAFGTLGGAVGAASVTLMYPEAQWASASLLVSGGFAGWFSVWLSRKVPRAFVDEVRRGGGLRLGWVVLSLVALLQIARLATYVSNPESNWFVTTAHPFYAKHECQSAYFFGAELGLRGEDDLYHPAHYPGLNPDAKPETDLVGMHPEDPYQYPPTFLLLPRALMLFSSDYAAMRSVWFALNVTLCVSAVILLGAWIGRRKSWKFLLFSPALLTAFPVLHNFQYGQFHFAAIALSILGLLAFEKKRLVAGGGLLAFGIVAKLFPGLLLFLLIGRKKWEELAATLVALGGFVVLGLLVVGPQAHSAFIFSHVPRLLDGSAFAFGKAWPEVADLVVAGNQGVSGIFQKLSGLGLGLPASVSKGIGVLYFLILPVLAYFVGRRANSAAPELVSIGWLGVLGLGSLASAGAWADYVPLLGAWVLLYLLLLERSDKERVFLWGSAFFQFTLFGAVPLGPYADAWWMTPTSLVGALLLLATFVRAVSPVRREERSGAPSSAGSLSGAVYSMRHE